MKVAVIVLSYNSTGYISECLTSLLKLALGDTQLQVIVVDNASTDDSVKLVSEKFPSVKVISNSQNVGYAEGNNVGIRQALADNADFIWIVNPDMTVEHEALSELMLASTKYPAAGIFGYKIYFAPGFECHKDRYSREDLGRVIWYAGFR
jgi:GT2 family glycosyltransferase